MRAKQIFPIITSCVERGSLHIPVISYTLVTILDEKSCQVAGGECFRKELQDFIYDTKLTQDKLGNLSACACARLRFRGFWNKCQSGFGTKVQLVHYQLSILHVRCDLQHQQQLASHWQSRKNPKDHVQPCFYQSKLPA